jgi:hypothetical protein
MQEKLPVITSTEDTKLKLADVLYAAGVLRLTGSNLLFDENDAACGCVLEGTRSGKKRQSTYGSVANSAILLVPDIPAQANPWNNEYTVTLTTQYTEHGTLRSGTCRRKLRTPLTVSLTGIPQPSETGILSSNEASPLVSITGGTVSANELVRVQAVIDSRSGQLLLSVLDMQEGGRTGTAVTVTANGDYTLQGFSDSAVTQLDMRVDDMDALISLIRNSYAGRLVDILDIQV